MVVSCLTRHQPSKTHSLPVLCVPVGRTLLLTGRPSACGSWDQLPDDQCLHTSAPSAQSASLLRQVIGVSHSKTARYWYGVHQLRSDIQPEERFTSISGFHEAPQSVQPAQTSTAKHSIDRGSTPVWQSLLFNMNFAVFTGHGQQQQCWQYKQFLCDESKEVQAW